MIARRSFLAGLGSLLAAPAIVHAGNLMPVKASPLSMSMRCITEYAIGSDAAVWQLDIPYGFMELRPEWACQGPRLIACPSN